MAAPPEDLRAHDRGSETPCECQKFEETGGKLFTGQIVGITPKCRMSPSRVRSIRDGLAAASQVRKPDVADPRSVERGLECQLLRLRLASGAGKASDIGDKLDSIHGEYLEKVCEWAGGVPHGPHRQGHAKTLVARATSVSRLFIARTTSSGDQRSRRHRQAGS